MAKVSTPHILHRHVSIRRSGRVVRNVLTQSLISDIKQGRLKKMMKSQLMRKTGSALIDIINWLVIFPPKTHLPPRIFRLT